MASLCPVETAIVKRKNAKSGVKQTKPTDPNEIQHPVERVKSVVKQKKPADPKARRLNLSEKLNQVTTELAERDKQYNLLVAECKPREVELGCVEKCFPVTMLVHVYIDTVYKGNYRVFCDTKVSTIFDDIRLRHTFSGICADMFHETRILLPADMLCSQLKDIFVLDVNGDATIHFSTGMDLIML